MLFQEKTHFNRFIIIPLFPLLLFALYQSFEARYNLLHHDFIVPFSAAVLVLLIILLLYFSELKVEFYSNHLEYRFFPFIRTGKKINYQDIEDWKVLKIDPLSEFGGWGYRKSKKYGRGLITDSHYILTIETSEKPLSLSIQNIEKIKNILTQNLKK